VRSLALSRGLHKQPNRAASRTPGCLLPPCEQGAEAASLDATRLGGFEVTELAHRTNDGVDVSLYWDRGAEDLLVFVEDQRTGDRFSLSASRDRALDVFYHPYAYAVAAVR